jgi:hypothetical protein
VPAILILISDRSWYGPARDQSATLRCVASLPDPARKIRVERGSWATEVEQRNYSLALATVAGAQYALIIDADELYHSEQLSAAITLAASEPSVDCWHVNWVTYWKSVRHRIDPIEGYQPVVLMKLGTCAYIETRNPVGNNHKLIPPEVALCHHMSYALPDERIRLKHISFEGHSQSAYSGWYEKIWRGWDSNPELLNLHPNNPEAFKRAVPIPKEYMPSVLWHIYDGAGLP